LAKRDIQRGLSETELIDGKTLTLFGDCLNLYTQIEVPGTLDNLVDVLPDE